MKILLISTTWRAGITSTSHSKGCVFNRCYRWFCWPGEDSLVSTSVPGQYLPSPERCMLGLYLSLDLAHELQTVTFAAFYAPPCKCLSGLCTFLIQVVPLHPSSPLSGPSIHSSLDGAPIWKASWISIVLSLPYANPRTSLTLNTLPAAMNNKIFCSGPGASCVFCQPPQSWGYLFDFTVHTRCSCLSYCCGCPSRHLCFQLSCYLFQETFFNHLITSTIPIGFPSQ
jgi:hypothetical protein